MAVAVDFRDFKPVDSREDLIRRVEQAPIEHAAAVLAAYDLLQLLHEKGLLDLLNGLLSGRHSRQPVGGRRQLKGAGDGASHRADVHQPA
jgi:hypothetical protein